MNKLVFFVDDDTMILNLLEYTFNNQRDYDIKTFSSGKDCIDNLHLNPDLIVLDHVFKDDGQVPANGLQTLKEIRKTHKDIPVLVLSNLDDEIMQEWYKEGGATSYIPKNDYFIDNLMEAIDREL